MTSPASENPPNHPKPTRRKTLVRATDEALPSMQLTARDLAILNGLYTCRALTTPQIQRWFFQAAPDTLRGATVRCQARLKLLFHHGYVARDEQPVRLAEGRRPLVYFLDRRGADTLAGMLHVKRTELDWRPQDILAGASHLFLTHLLKTNDVRIALELAATAGGCALMRWLDERMLRRAQMKDLVVITDPHGRRRQIAVVPDSYFAVSQGETAYHQFLEIDLHTTTGLSQRDDHRDWARRVQAYVTYHQTGKYQARYHAENFRVLTVTTDHQRLAHLKTITEQAGGRARFWFTTLASISPETVLSTPIWQVAGRAGLLPLLV